MALRASGRSIVHTAIGPWRSKDRYGVPSQSPSGRAGGAVRCQGELCHGTPQVRRNIFTVTLTVFCGVLRRAILADAVHATRRLARGYSSSQIYRELKCPPGGRWCAKLIDGMSRRQFLAKAAAASSPGAFMSLAGPVIEKAYGAGPCSGHLTDIEHIVLLMQENRSFDHYFGTLSGVNGFSTRSPLSNRRAGTPRRRRWTPPASRSRSASTPPGAPCSTGNASRTPTTPGSRCTGMEQRRQRQWLPSQYSKPSRATSRDNGLLHPRRPPDPLPAGRHVHHLRCVPLFAVGPDTPTGCTG